IRAIAAEENGGSCVEFAPDAMAALLAYRWPGNIRELRNALRTAIAISGGGLIALRHLPPAPGTGRMEALALETPTIGALPPPTAAGANPLAAAERARLLLELERHRWKATATAAALGISRNTLYRKLHKHGIPIAADGLGGS
ncbi:MAG: helix-turn-helix domain-containing protein, partial [Acetobacteraceae bacterium]